MDFQEVFQAVEAQADRLAGMLSDLIKIDTSVPPGSEYPRMLDYLEPLLAAAGLQTKRVVVPEERWRAIPLPLEGERVNLVATLASGKPPVSIYAHMDVVPAGEGWTVDPFGGEIRDGEIFGRGAVDMKGSIPPVVVALEVMKKLGLEPRFDVTVLLCTDEEVGIDPGAAYLAELGYFEPPILHLEGGGQGPAMIAANAGSLKVTITVYGREVHSGLSFFGINALEEAIPVMQELADLKRVVEKRESSFDSFPLPGIPSPKMTPTFNLNVMTAGEKLNMVPARAELQIDRRYLPDEDLGEVQAEILDAVGRGRERCRAEKVDVDFQVIYPPHAIDLHSEHVRRWCEGVRLALGYPADLEFIYPGATGATDMSFVRKIVGTDLFVGTGVLDPEHLGAHQADESVPIANLVHLCQELLYFLIDLD
jgi:succinyl-diaminopimelate desuccinylase